MRIFAVILGVTLALGLAACGSSNPVTPPAPVLDGTIAGQAMNGGPVANATVMVTPVGAGAAVTAITDGSGNYTVDVQPGAYNVLAYKDVEYDDFTATGVAVVSSTTTTQDITFVAAATYVGHAACMGCHNTSVNMGEDNIHSDWSTSGHRFKINLVTGGVAPTYPFTMLPDYFGGALLDDTTADEGTAPDPDGVAGTTDNPNGTPASWNDVSYVIGGWGWKARLMDSDGYIVTGTEVQYNYWDGTIFDWTGGGGQMSAYHNNEGAVGATAPAKTPKYFNCGNCHTTGWRHQDDTLHDMRQGGLAGIDGTFAATGIECEACHGAGSRHAAAPSTTNITRIATPRTTAQLQAHGAGYGLPVTCGECHTRDGERDYPTYMSAANNAGWNGDANWPAIGGRIAVSGDFIRHHEQYDEMIGIDPDTMASTRNAAFAAAHGDCGTCHEPHATTHHQGSAVNAPFVAPSKDGVSMDCQTCHVDTATSVYTLDGHLGSGGARPTHCIDCHMPYLSKSALATYTPPAGSDRPPEGDVSSHIFSINLQRDPANQFTASGSFAYPELTGQHACQRCHDAVDGIAFPLTMPRPAGATRVHAAP